MNTPGNKDRMITIKTSEGEIKVPSKKIDEAWNRIVYGRIPRDELLESLSRAYQKVRCAPIEKLVSYWFSSAEIDDLEQKTWGITSTIWFSWPIDELEKALAVNKHSSELEKAYFKLKFKEMTLVGTGLSCDFSGFESFIRNASPLEPEVFRKLEFYWVNARDFLRIQPALLPHLAEIFLEVEKKYGIPESLSVEVREQVKDHLMQELEIQKGSAMI